MKNSLSRGYETKEYDNFDPKKLETIFEDQKKAVSVRMLNSLLWDKWEDLYNTFIALRKDIPIESQNKNLWVTDLILREAYLKEKKYESLPALIAFNTQMKLIDNEKKWYLVPSILYSLELIQQISISFVSEKQEEKFDKWTYFKDSNRIEVYLDNHGYLDYDEVTKTVFHEIEHPISETFESKNEKILEWLNQVYFYNVYNLLKKEYSNIADIELNMLRTQVFLEKIWDYLDEVNKSKKGNIEITASEVNEIVDWTLLVLSLSNKKPHELARVINAFKNEYIEYTSKVFNLVTGLTPNKEDIIWTIYPVLIDKLFDIYHPKVYDLNNILREEKGKITETSNYLLDTNKLTDEYRTRILTTKHFLEQHYVICTYRKTWEQLIAKRKGDWMQFTNPEYWDIITIDESELSWDPMPLYLETEEDRRNFVKLKSNTGLSNNGLKVIENEFSMENRILIEAFFVEDENWNDQVDQLVKIWNWMVYEDIIQENKVYW